MNEPSDRRKIPFRVKSLVQRGVDWLRTPIVCAEFAIINSTPGSDCVTVTIWFLSACGDSSCLRKIRIFQQCVAPLPYPNHWPSSWSQSGGGGTNISKPPDASIISNRRRPSVRFIFSLPIHRWMVMGKHSREGYSNSCLLVSTTD